MNITRPSRWGRKRALVLSCTLVGAIGSLKAFSISYEMYVIVEFLETVAGASTFPAAYILSENSCHIILLILIDSMILNIYC
jgi:MFS family permease